MWVHEGIPGHPHGIASHCVLFREETEASHISAPPSPAELCGKRSPESSVDYWFGEKTNHTYWQIAVNEKSVLRGYENVCTSEDCTVLFKGVLLLRRLWILNQSFVVRGMLLRRKENVLFNKIFSKLRHIHYGHEHGGGSDICITPGITLHSVTSFPRNDIVHKETWVLWD